MTRVDMDPERLHLGLGLWEKVLCVRLSDVVVARDQVTMATNRLVPASWRDLRAPGTAVPGLIRAGTYYTPRGKEFWFVSYRGRGGPLRIELEGAVYRRIVLTLEDHVELADRINAWCGHEIDSR